MTLSKRNSNLFKGAIITYVVYALVCAIVPIATICIAIHYIIKFW
jgi:hypothetical protein